MFSLDMVYFNNFLLAAQRENQQYEGEINQVSFLKVQREF